ncbi:MAG TPA: hypothetical protein VD903_16640 [Pseudonocardia sp.]|nr:hypothetical protein [Pseudonocardia sp.]
MSADQEYSADSWGDYTYDLAHEVRTTIDALERPRTARTATAAGAPFEADPHGDLGYDCAHGS